VDILKFLGLDPTTNFEAVTSLSASNQTHPLLQTVIDGRADFAPYEVGITLNRYKLLGKHILCYLHFIQSYENGFCKPPCPSSLLLDYVQYGE
jgi:hypothetical protein